MNSPRVLNTKCGGVLIKRSFVKSYLLLLAASFFYVLLMALIDAIAYETEYGRASIGLPRSSAMFFNSLNLVLVLTPLILCFVKLNLKELWTNTKSITYRCWWKYGIYICIIHWVLGSIQTSACCFQVMALGISFDYTQNSSGYYIVIYLSSLLRGYLSILFFYVAPILCHIVSYTWAHKNTGL